MSVGTGRGFSGRDEEIFTFGLQPGISPPFDGPIRLRTRVPGRDAVEMIGAQNSKVAWNL
jgi:hypothetical protein